MRKRTHTLLAHVQYASWMCVCVCMIIYIHIYTHTYKYILYIYIYIPRAKPHTPSHQLNPKPSKPSCTALRRLFRSCSSLVYSGKSSWLKHVCDEGSLFLSPHRWMLNFCQTPQRQHGSSRTPSPTSSLPSPHFALPSLLQKPLQAQVRTMHAPITTAAYLWTVHAAERLEALHGHLAGAHGGLQVAPRAPARCQSRTAPTAPDPLDPCSALLSKTTRSVANRGCILCTLCSRADPRSARRTEM